MWRRLRDGDWVPIPGSTRFTIPAYKAQGFARAVSEGVARLASPTHNVEAFSRAVAEATAHLTTPKR
jgi:hypothetical protein